MERTFYEGWFDFRGTRSRASYIGASIIVILALLASLFVDAVLFGATLKFAMSGSMMLSDPAAIESVQTQSSIYMLIGLVWLLVSGVFFMMVCASLTAQRLRSMGVQDGGGLVGLTFLFSLLWILFTLFLMIFPSKEQMSGEVVAKQKASAKKPAIDKHELLGGVVIIGVPVIIILLVISIFN